ncbi:retron St85 family RNA-directed DNA polymerase [Aeromonas salmonicida]|uniref:retron St85 family RNA-directed DNA polymerase n=1 Tax=Aeromonas salmonicida TaxID=645 RepID=UPI00370D7FA8
MSNESITDTICNSLSLLAHELLIKAMKAPSSYRIYTIPKRSGGKRTIAQPTAEVKNIQRCIVRTVLDPLPTSDISTAYKRDLSIKDNAKKHLGKKFILKMDFKDFFPSIYPEDLIKSLERCDIKLNSIDRKILILFLFRRNKYGRFELSVGAPSSPIVSNIVMYEFDIAVKEYCEKHSIVFTRYADDLTFSSNSIEEIKKIPTFIKHNLMSMDSPKLAINEKKTHLVSKGRSQRVTGVILTHDDKLSIGRNLRKKIRAMLHLYKANRLEHNDIPYLHGIVSHMRNIEPEHFNKLLEFYGDVIFKELAKASFNISKVKN